MKIGVNSRIFREERGGISHYIESLYGELLKLDKKNDYVFFQPGEERKIGDTRIIKTPGGKMTGAFLFDNFLVSNLIKKEKINIFHGPSNILPISGKGGTKYILTVHDLAFLKVPQTCSLLYKNYYKLNLRRSLKKADIILADSKSTKNDIMELYKLKESKIKVVYLGVDNAFWETKRKKRMVKGKYFFTVATHPKRKNISGVLKAFAHNNHLKGFKYVIAGTIFDEEYRKELNEIIEKLELSEKVITLGYVKEEDLINLYQNAEFFIHPSLYEGFGFPVLEAMVSNCPVIISNNSSLPELAPSQKWLVDPHNIEDIKNKMEKMIGLSKKEKDKLIKENYAFAKKFTWRDTALKMIDIFNNL